MSPTDSAAQAAHTGTVAHQAATGSAVRATQHAAQEQGRIDSGTQMTDEDLTTGKAMVQELLDGDRDQEPVVQLRSHEQLLEDLAMPCDPGYDPTKFTERELLIGVMVRDDQVKEPTAWERKKPSTEQVVTAVSEWLSEYMPRYRIRRGDRHVVEAYARGLLETRPNLTVWDLPCILNIDVPYGISGSFSSYLPTKAASRHFRGDKGTSTSSGPFERFERAA